MTMAHRSPPEASLKQTAHNSAQSHCTTIKAPDQVGRVCTSYQATALDTMHLRTTNSVRLGALPYLEKGQHLLDVGAVAQGSAWGLVRQPVEVLGCL